MDNARTGRRTVVWIVAGAAMIVAIVVAVAVAARPTANDEIATSGPPPEGDSCDGVDAQSIDLDQQVVDPAPRTCFELDETRQVSVGAAALEPEQSLHLTLLDSDGEELGAATSEPGWDPEVGLTLDPGTYVVEVEGESGDAPPFLLSLATFPPPSDEPAAAAELPPVGECGTSVPVAADDAPVEVSEDDGEQGAHYACVVLEQPTFVKVGLASAEPSKQDAPDLQLALYRHGDETALVRTSDDVIGLDPEMSLALEAGTYLLEATAWFEAPTGPFEFYVDDDADLFRHGQVTTMHANATPDLCDDAPQLAPGDAITVEGENTYLCATTPSDERLTLEAATLRDQDLVLEVIGFDGDGTPYRLAFADGDPSSDALANVDPVLDQVLPEGTWLVAVTTYDTSVAADYDIALEPAEAR